VAATVIGGKDSWRVEDDLRTLMSAAKIRADKVRMKNVVNLAKQKVIKMKEIAEGKESS